jgi:hypothetical protein
MLNSSWRLDSMDYSDLKTTLYRCVLQYFWAITFDWVRGRGSIKICLALETSRDEFAPLQPN